MKIEAYELLPGKETVGHELPSSNGDSLVRHCWLVKSLLNPRQRYSTRGATRQSSELTAAQKEKERRKP